MSEEQKEIIEVVKRELEFWENTNDLSSPTHSTDIREFVQLLELDPEQEDQLINGLLCILSVIRNYDYNVKVE